MNLGIGLGLAFRPVIGGGSSVPVGPVADVLLDFVNNIYRVDGTTYATAALAGFAGTGTFNTSGYTAGAGDRLLGSVSLPGDFIVFADFDQTVTTGALFAATATAFQVVWLSGSGLYSVTPGTGVTVPGSATRVSHGRSGGVLRASFNNGAVSGSGAFTAPGSVTVSVGNTVATNDPWTVPIRKFAIYKQTLTDAQIQALT